MPHMYACWLNANIWSNALRIWWNAQFAECALHIDRNDTCYSSAINICIISISMIRWICGAKLEDEISSAVLHQKLDLDDITAVLHTRRLRWYGHVQRATSCINSITRLGLPGTRDRGRPRKTWSACFWNDMTIYNLDGVNPLDRISWRTSVRRCLPRSLGQPQHLKYQNRIWWWRWLLLSPSLFISFKKQ